MEYQKKTSYMLGMVRVVEKCEVDWTEQEKNQEGCGKINDSLDGKDIEIYYNHQALVITTIWSIIFIICLPIGIMLDTIALRAFLLIKRSRIGCTKIIPARNQFLVLEKLITMLSFLDAGFLTTLFLIAVFNFLTKGYERVEVRSLNEAILISSFGVPLNFLGILTNTYQGFFEYSEKYLGIWSLYCRVRRRGILFSR